MAILSYCDETIGVAPETSVAEAVAAMLEQSVGAVAVVDDGNVVLGMFTERDVMTKVALSRRDPAVIPVAEMMSSTVFLATCDTTPGEALTAMINNHVRHLPVVDDRGRLLGMLPLRNLLQAHVKELSFDLDALARARGAGAA